MVDIDQEPVKVDVLVAGGGIAGLMAAISAAKKGVSVAVAEKANTRRSGCGATGNDHFMCYIPEVHGDDLEPILAEYLNSQVGGFSDLALARKFLEQSYERVKDWDGWGISMRPKGCWDFSGHAFPGRPRIWLKYAGHNQKEVLTREARRHNVRIMNHLSVAEVITSKGKAIGALAISARDEKPVVKVFQTKCIVLTTGCGSRLYPGVTPGWMFNTANCPACTGSGQAIAYRAGAKLVNMEFPNRHAGPKYFARCGKATWIGLYKDPQGGIVGPFVTKATKELGDITGDVWSSVFTDKFKSGMGPVYMDCSTTSEDDLEYMMWGLVQEGNTAMLNYMAEEGIDVRKHMVEFMQYEPFLVGRGIEINTDGETSLSGLFAAGDLVGNFRADCAGAATFGWIAGGSAAKKAKSIGEFKGAGRDHLVEERLKLYSEFLSRKSGPSWKEANLCLQQIMNDYAGVKVRSETLLKAGMKYLKDLKEKVLTGMSVENSHTLVRGLETLDLIECGEVVFQAALERKETRGLHKRSDFPFTNPLLDNKFLTVRQEQGRLKLEWREKN
ncbi:MAG: FAD-binding protein [Deltaproteobacteria bacterium]|nr:FAD-binding protein [Deltaproteobacteria bacterium]